jgi:hypothetical protein
MPDANSLTYRLTVFCIGLLLHLYPGSIAGAQSAATDPPPTALLVGTVQNSRFSGAVFDDGTGKQTFYRLSDRLPGGEQVISIEKSSILIKQTDGTVYELFVVGGKRSPVTPAPSIESPSPAQKTIPPRTPSRRNRNRRIGRDG